MYVYGFPLIWKIYFWHEHTEPYWVFLAKITNLANHWAKIQTQVVWHKKSTFNFHETVSINSNSLLFLVNAPASFSPMMLISLFFHHSSNNVNIAGTHICSLFCFAFLIEKHSKSHTFFFFFFLFLLFSLLSHISFRSFKNSIFSLFSKSQNI